MARSHRAFLAAFLLAATMLVAPTPGDPILPPTKTKLGDTVLSLARVKQVEVVVERLPPELRAVGLTADDIKARWSRRLTDENFEVADGKGYPRVVLRSIATVDRDVPNAVAYAFVISFQQEVRIERLNQTLFVPTFSETLMGLETVDHLGHAAIVNINQAVDLVINGVKAANRNGEE